jgi:uncharacterized membrane protein YfcA
MWETYRKRFLFTQVFILVACALLHLYFGRPWPVVAVFFLVMELGAVIGAWWAHRLTLKIQTARDRLPLDKR